VFLVTGGRSEIAITIANELAKLDEVILVTRDSKTFPKSNLEDSVKLMELNLLDTDASLKLLQAIKFYSIRNICFAHRLRKSDGSEADRFFGEVLQTNNLLNLFLKNFPDLEKRVVILTSPATDLVKSDQDFIYHATKSALKMLVRYFAVHHSSDSLIINSVAPGSFVEKDRSKDFYKVERNLYMRIIKTIPSGKMTQKKEIANLVKYLLTDSPRSMSGTHVLLDSGLTLVEPSGLISND